MPNKLFCVIVDAFSTGNQLAPMLHGYGFSCVHVQSMDPLLPVCAPSFQPRDFVETIVHRGNMEITVQAVQKYAPVFLINGSETGTVVADQLAQRLGLPGNPASSSLFRRNKYIMAERMRAKGVLAVNHFQSDNVDALVDWAEKLDDWPVVVKPLDSAGSDGVTFCSNVGAIRNAAGQIIGVPNRLGGNNTQILIQQYLRGEQYIVNTVSINGKHIVGEIEHAAKKMVPGVGLVYDYEEILSLRGDRQEAIAVYIHKVLDALEFYHGPGHAELAFTSKGPVLIEIASRMHGGILHPAVSRALEYSHVALTVEAYACSEKLLKQKQINDPLKACVFYVHLIASKAGIVRHERGIERIFNLPSYHSHLRLPKTGTVITPTIDLFTAPGDVYLAHASREQVWKDFQQIREWERDGSLYALE